MERLLNEFTVDRPIGETWGVLTDVERIAPCLPGAQLQEIEGDTYRGVVKVKLGPITTAFKGQAEFVERDDAAHRAVLRGQGRDTGGKGNADALITAQLEPLDERSTRCVVTTELHITGKVAQFGRGILGDVSEKLMAQFAHNLNTMLDAAGAAPADMVTDAPSAVSTEVADAPARADTTTVAASAVRTVHGPEAAPIELSGLAGGAVAKRVIPLIVGLVALALVVRALV